jgi:hypothetical protein
METDGGDRQSKDKSNPNACCTHIQWECTQQTYRQAN